MAEPYSHARAVAVEQLLAQCLGGHEHQPREVEDAAWAETRGQPNGAPHRREAGSMVSQSASK